MTHRVKLDIIWSCSVNGDQNSVDDKVVMELVKSLFRVSLIQGVVGLLP